MSLKPMPGSGKSGTSRTRRLAVDGRHCPASYGRCAQKRSWESSCASSASACSSSSPARRRSGVARSAARARRAASSRPDSRSARCGTYAGAAARCRSGTASRRRRRCRRRSRRRAASALDARLEQPELLQLARALGLDPGPLAEPRRGRAPPRLAERRTPAAALSPAPARELLTDHAQRQELVALHAQDRLQPFDVVLAEQPVAALRPPRREQALVLEVADLGDRDVRELGLEPPADRADREQSLRGLGAVEPSRVRKVSRYLPIWSSSPSSSSADLDALAVDEGAVQAALVLDEPAAVALHEHRVLARDGDVVEEDPAVGRAADRRALALRARRSRPSGLRPSGRRARGPRTPMSLERLERARRPPPAVKVCVARRSPPRRACSSAPHLAQKFAASGFWKPHSGQ